LEFALRSLVVVSERLELLRTAEEAAELAKAAGEDPKALVPIETRFVAAVVDATVQGGLAANVHRLHSAANQVRERMSTDNWHVFNRLPQRLPGPQATVSSALASLDEVMLACVSLAGFAMDDMTRDESWHFLLLGRRIERLAHVTAMVAHVLRLPAAQRADALEWLLEAANSIVTFRARYRRAPELLPVLHLVVFDESNPHSVAFQLRELWLTVERTATELGREVSTDVLGPIATTLRTVPLEGFEPEEGSDLEAACKSLAALLGRAQRAAVGLSDELQRRFFSHAGTPAPLGRGTVRRPSEAWKAGRTSKAEKP
jgi:uncharacterized alpha-E superfamily protein